MKSRRSDARLRSPLHRCLPQASYQEGSKKATGVLAQQSFGQRDEEDASLVHARGEVDGGAGLAHDVAHGRTQQNRPQLVQHRARRLQTLAFGHVVPLVPEGLQPDGIVEIFDEDLACIGLEEQQGHFAQAAARVPHKRENRGAQQVVCPWSPEPFVCLAEDRDYLIARDLVLIRVVALEQIETDRLFAKGRIDQHDTAPVLARDALQEVVDQIPLGSITAIPRPAWMSSRARFIRAVLLPTPVGPMNCMWCSASEVKSSPESGVRPRGDRRSFRRRSAVAPEQASSAQPQNPGCRPAGGTDLPARRRPESCCPQGRANSRLSGQTAAQTRRRPGADRWLHRSHEMLQSIPCISAFASGSLAAATLRRISARYPGATALAAGGTGREGRVGRAGGVGCSGNMRWKSPSNTQPSTELSRPRSGGTPANASSVRRALVCQRSSGLRRTGSGPRGLQPAPA